MHREHVIIVGTRCEHVWNKLKILYKLLQVQIRVLILYSSNMAFILNFIDPILESFYFIFSNAIIFRQEI